MVFVGSRVGTVAELQARVADVHSTGNWDTSNDAIPFNFTGGFTVVMSTPAENPTLPPAVLTTRGPTASPTTIAPTAIPTAVPTFVTVADVAISGTIFGVTCSTLALGLNIGVLNAAARASVIDSGVATSDIVSITTEVCSGESSDQRARYKQLGRKLRAAMTATFTTTIVLKGDEVGQDLTPLIELFVADATDNSSGSCFAEIELVDEQGAAVATVATELTTGAYVITAGGTVNPTNAPSTAIPTSWNTTLSNGCVTIGGSMVFALASISLAAAVGAFSYNA